MMTALMEPAPLYDAPTPINCIRCGAPMMFHGERFEPDGKGPPDHVRVYFCRTHGFFHFSDRKQLTEGM